MSKILYHLNLKEADRVITFLFESNGWIVGEYDFFGDGNSIYVFCPECMYFQTSLREQVHSNTCSKLETPLELSNHLKFIIANSQHYEP